MIDDALSRIGVARLAGLLCLASVQNAAAQDLTGEAHAVAAEANAVTAISPAIVGAASAVAVPVASSAVMPAAFYGMAEAARSDLLLRESMLAAHNGERTALGLPALEWDDARAVDAARYASEMAQTGAFRHSPKALRAIPAGENLWMGPRRLYGYEVMVGSFMAEKKDFKADERLPHFSTTGKWQDVGHYTQAIWRGTKMVGCALGDGPDYEYLVCRYFPAGNAFGKGPFDEDEAMLPAPIPASAAAAVATPVPVSAPVAAEGQ